MSCTILVGRSWVELGERSDGQWELEGRGSYEREEEER